MHAEIRCYLVDWDRFTEEYADTRSLRRTLMGSIKVLRVSYCLVLMQDGLVRAAEAIRDVCPGQSAEALCELFRHLFWTYCSQEYQIVDLSPNPPRILEVAWNVETTRRFAEVADRIRMEDFCVFFEVGNPHLYRSLYDRLEEFSHDAEAWIETVKEARSGGRGLVVAEVSERIW
jgi:hypothetical protein